MNNIKTILVGIVAIATVFAVFCAAEAAGIITSSTHYIGTQLVETEQAKTELIEIIETNANHGPLNVWKPGYRIETLDGGQIIIHYAFFSENSELDLSKDGDEK